MDWNEIKATKTPKHWRNSIESNAKKNNKWLFFFFFEYAIITNAKIGYLATVIAFWIIKYQNGDE